MCLCLCLCLCLFVFRCLASETECDKLRERATELRRKVDDTQAALLELGRENQSLQVTTHGDHTASNLEQVAKQVSK